MSRKYTRVGGGARVQRYGRCSRTDLAHEVLLSENNDILLRGDWRVDEIRVSRL